MEVWVKFFRDAGIPSGPASTYAMKFCDHRIRKDMLADIDKGILHDMGISVMGDVIAILKHAKAVHAMSEREKLESEYIGQFKVSGLVSSQMDNNSALKAHVPERVPPLPKPLPKPPPSTKPTPNVAPKPAIPQKPATSTNKGQAKVLSAPAQAVKNMKRKSSDNLKESLLKANEVSSSRKSTPARVDSTTSQTSPIKTVTVTKKSLSERFSGMPGSSKFSDPLKNKDTDFIIKLNTSVLGGVGESAGPAKKAKLAQHATPASTPSPSAQRKKQAATLVTKAVKSGSQKKSVFDRLGEEHAEKPKEKTATVALSSQHLGKKTVKTAKPPETKFKSLKPLKKVTVVKSKPEEKVTGSGSVFSRLGAGPEIPQQPAASHPRRKQEAKPSLLWEDDEDDYVIDYTSQSVLQPAEKRSAAKPVKPVKPLRRLSPDTRVPSSSVFQRLGNKM